MGIPFTAAEYHFPEAGADFPVGVQLGEPQIFKRLLPEEFFRCIYRNLSAPDFFQDFFRLHGQSFFSGGRVSFMLPVR